jgi:transposase
MTPLLTMIPGCPGLRIDDLILTPDLAVAVVASTASDADCPRCGTASCHLHSHYRRTVADLPCPDRMVALRLVVRRFRCSQPGCTQSIFCERLPGLLAAQARSTDRLASAHRALGLALGGEAGSRLADRLDMPTSPDTLLRRVKNTPDEVGPPPRYIGIDDWAIRKGQRYGTILIDLERGRVIDLLPGRDGSALAAWLKEHPTVEIITRDRWASFAQAATEAAPQARQIADRWHLLKNLREAVERLLARLSTPVAEALREPAQAPGMEIASWQESLEHAATVPPPGEPLPAAQPGLPPEGSSPSPRQQAREAKRQQRAARHEQVRELHRQGLSQREIVRRTGLSRKVVRRYCREDRCPDWKGKRRPYSTLHAYAAEVEQWIEAGGRNAAELYRELKGRGCAVSYDAVRRFVKRRLGSTGRPGPRTGPVVVRPPPLPSARQLSFEFIRRPERREVDEQTRMDKLRACDAVLQEGLDLAGEFAEMVRKQADVPLTTWLLKVEKSSCPELRSFAAGVRQDEAAVTAALTEPWSNGPVEGHVNRLKMIKRQMYGRAGLELLRARVRFAS